MPDKEKAITLTTTTNQQSGELCVRRNPRGINERRSDVDVVRLINGNQLNSGRSITIGLDPATAIKMFDPVPPETTVLDAGHSVEWQVRDDLAGTVVVRFTTNPDICGGGDQDDVVIRC